jgi:hypothetical protein
MIRVEPRILHVRASMEPTVLELVEGSNSQATAPFGDWRSTRKTSKSIQANSEPDPGGSSSVFSRGKPVVSLYWPILGIMTVCTDAPRLHLWGRHHTEGWWE